MPRPRRSKYNAMRTIALGRSYPSKLEAAYATKLSTLQAGGELLYWIEQAPLRLPGGTVYRLDFLEVWEDGRVIGTEVKGRDTPVGSLKLRQAREMYPHLPIQVVRRV